MNEPTKMHDGGYQGVGGDCHLWNCTLSAVSNTTSVLI